MSSKNNEEEVINLTGNLDNGLATSESKMALNLQLSNPVAREWFNTRRNNIRAWTVFLNTGLYQTPQSAAQMSQRILRNLDYFQSNYFFVFLALMIYCIITSPLLLLALVASGGGGYIVSLRNHQNPPKILGHEIRESHQYALVFLLSIPFFIIAGAGGAFFWVLGASFFVIMLHASFFGFENLPVSPAEEKFAVETV